MAIAIAPASIAAAIGVSAAAVVTVGAIAVRVGISLIVLDYAVTLGPLVSEVPPVSRPAVATLPEPPGAPFPGAISSAYLTAPLPGNEANAFVAAVNSVTGAFNVINNDILTGQFDSVFQDVLVFRNTLGSVAEQYRDLFGSHEASIPQLNFSQADIDGIRAQVAQSGFPPFVVASLLDGGFSSSTIEGVTTLMGGTQINLAVPTVSGSQLFDTAANITFVPEPGTLVLFCVGGVAAIGVHHMRRRFQAKLKPFWKS